MSLERKHGVTHTEKEELFLTQSLAWANASRRKGAWHELSYKKFGIAEHKGKGRGQ